MKISVALAAKNGEKYLLDQVASILMQLTSVYAGGTLCESRVPGLSRLHDTKHELIISVDTSQDNTLALARRFAANSPLITVLQGPDKGIIANVENAINATSGELIFLADQDDVWLPGKVEEVAEAFVSTNIAVLLHDAMITDEQLLLTAPSYFELRGTRPGLMDNLIQNHFVGACMAFNARFKPWILPFPHDIPMHDQWIGLMAEQYGAVAYYKKQLIKYRRHSGNITTIDTSGNSPLQMLKWRRSLLKALRVRAKKMPEWQM